MRICNLANSVPFKKKPFHGRELICFANPRNPGGPGESGESEKEDKIFEDLKRVVPGRMEYDHERRWDMHAGWMSLIGTVDGIQNHIKSLVKDKKELEDDKIFNKPKFRKQFQAILKPKYEELMKIAGTLPHVAPGTMKRIREQARGEINVSRGQYIADLEEVVQGLLHERKEKLQEVGEMMRGNISDRLKHLRKNWQENTPNGYADVKDAWIEYTEQLEKTINGQDFANLDDGSLEFPNGSALYKDAEKWWNVVNQLEDSYKDFTRYGKVPQLDEHGQPVYDEHGEIVYVGNKELTPEGGFSDLTDEALKGEFEKLKAQVAADFNEEEIRKFHASVDKVLKESANMKEELEYRVHQAHGAEQKFWEDQLKVLNDKVAELNGHKNIEEQIEEALFSKDPVLNDKGEPITYGASEMVVPIGIEAQLEFLRKAPMTNDARRAAARTLSEGMKGVAEKIHSYKDFSEVKLTETLENMRLFREGLDSNVGYSNREIILVNPFETMSQFWHTVTETVKGNVETEAGRGAGYFTKEATQILAKIPNPTNNQIIKSLTELSPNGAQHAEHKENGRVSDIEKGYEAFNTEHLMHVAAETIDRFEFKACLNLLAKRGRVDFYEPWLFKQLNRWQKTIKLPEDKYWHQKNLTASEEMMRQAYIYIYRDSEGFKSMKNSNASAYESKMGEYSKTWGGIAAQAGALVIEAERIIGQYEADHKADKHFSSADPIKFESIIRYSIDQGKMKAEDRMRLMVRGIASGLLPFDRGVNSTEKNNTYPPLDWFDWGTSRGQKPTIDDVRELDAYAKNSETWYYYMHKKIMYNEGVYQRLDKTLTQGSHRVDHDDAMMLAGYITAGTVKDMLTQKTSGGYGMPKTGLLSLATGNEFWLDMYAELYEGRDEKTNNLEISRFGAQFLMYEGILNRRTFKTTNMFRLDSDADKKPRSAGGYEKIFGRNGDASNSQLLSGVGDYLKILDFDSDFPLIKRLLNGEIKDDTEAGKICAELEGRYKIWKGAPPTNLNDLYERIGSYFDHAVKDPTRLISMVQQIKAGHDTKAFHDLQHSLHDPAHGADHAAAHVREAALQRAETGKEPAHH